MEYGYAFLMLAFAAGILLYAAMIAPGNWQLIARNYAADMRDPEAYAKQFAKVLALVALAPAASAVFAIVGVQLVEEPDDAIGPAFLVLIVVFVLCIRRGIKMMGELEEELDLKYGKRPESDEEWDE